MRERKELFLSLTAKENIARAVIGDALAKYIRPAIIWSGGKDSTTVLHLVKQVSESMNMKMPPSFFVDHGDHFPETMEFLMEVSGIWNIKLFTARNEDLLNHVKDGNVNVLELNAENQSEIKKIGFTGAEFSYSLDTEIGNHLLKTVPMNDLIRKYRFDALITGVRWDENPARSDDVFISPRQGHMRIQPIIPFLEKDIWEYIFKYSLPIHPLYRQGYRSIDGIHDSHKVSDKPAWEQDLERTKERAGRSQDKESMMEKLRALGYM